MLAAGDGTVRAIRDDAWLLLGFCSGLRRSELAGIRVEHLEFRLNHLSVVIARGKTDQDGRGRTVFFPRLGETALCPVRAVERWLKVAAISKGALFRRVSRSGGVLASGMSDRWVSESLKRRLEAAGLSSNGYSAHSLRAGFITTSILRGLDAASIMRQTGHSNPSAFVGYMRPLEQDLCESLSRLMEEKAVDGEN
jgi:integrase